MVLLPRWIVEGTFSNTAPLRIGTGEEARDPRIKRDDDTEGDANAVILGTNDRPLIPGSALKGAMRAWAERNGVPPADIGDLFGRAPEAGGADGGNGGRVVVGNALADPAPGGARLDLMPGIRRNPHTRAVEEGALFHHHAVPANTIFRARLVAEGVGRTAIDQLLRILAAFHAQPGGIRLGGNHVDGYGAVVWRPLALRRFGPEEARKWFASGRHTRWDRAAVVVGDVRWPQAAAVDQRAWTAQIDIDFQAAFAVNDALLVERLGRTAEAADIMPMTASGDGSGTPLLPSSSLRGALRAQASRICRTLGIDPAATAGPVQRLFGDSSRGSALSVTVTCVSPGAPFCEEFVAIDRFTGGASGSKKYNARGFWQPRFRAALRVDPTRLAIGHRGVATQPDAALGLLWLTLRDLADGDVPLGWGSAKGWGACRAALGPASVPPAWRDAVPAFAALRSATIPAQSRPLQLAEDFARATPAPEAVAAPSAAGGNEDLVNPYQFIPTTDYAAEGPSVEEVRGSLDDPNALLGGHSHARYAHGRLSGRLVARLTLEDPAVVGGRQERRTGDYALVHPFETPSGQNATQPAIPAATLRGLLSGWAERASRSALRVLDDRALSFRKEMTQALPLVGKLRVRKDGNGEKRYEILPLAVTHFTPSRDGAIKPHARFWRLFTHYDEAGRPRRDLEAPFPMIVRIGQYDGANQLKFDHNNPIFADTPPVSAEGWCGLKVPLLHIQPPGQPRRQVGTLYCPGTAQVGDILSWSRSAVTGQTCPPNNKATPTRAGVVRRLGREGRLDMPDTKYHELWIPYSRNRRNENGPLDVELDRRWLDVPPHVVDRFHELADERTDSQDNRPPADPRAWLPYGPEGEPRLPPGGPAPETDRRFKLKSGDLVFFDVAIVEEDDTDPDDYIENEADARWAAAASVRVTEVALSQIWRGRVETAKGERAGVHAFFRAISSELLPFSNTRQKITPAEWLFGFAGDESETQAAARKGRTSNAALAFAGKVRPGFARLVQAPQPGPWLAGPRPPNPGGADPWTPLKILSSPKPPSPAMYFHVRQQPQQYLPKFALRPGVHRPNGSKVYIHSSAEPDAGQAPWRTLRETENRDQKVRVRPLRPGCVFEFEIAFDNLTPEELGLLLFALRPTDLFRHRVGLGKSIGLGRCRIDVTKLDLRDRITRYTQGTDAMADATPQWRGLRDGFAGNLARSPGGSELYRAILAAGEPRSVAGRTVHMPLRANRALNTPDAEKETYAFFTWNDGRRLHDNQRQVLGPIRGGALRSLRRREP